MPGYFVFVTALSSVDGIVKGGSEVAAIFCVTVPTSGCVWELKMAMICVSTHALN